MAKKATVRAKKLDDFRAKVDKLSYDLTIFSPVKHVTVKRIYVRRLTSLLLYGKHYTKIRKFCVTKKTEFIHIFPLEIVKIYAEYLGCDYAKMLAVRVNKKDERD